MRFGFAVPHYDCSIAGANPLPFATTLEYAKTAERVGFDSLWVSDHLTWDLNKYGGGPQTYGVFEALSTLAAIARATTTARVGSLVLCEAIRPPAVLAKSLATIDRFSSGRLDVGLGAGWYAPDYEAVGMTMPSPGTRLSRLDNYLSVLLPMLAGAAPVTVADEFYSVVGATNNPPPQQTKVPVFIGGKGDRLLRMIARHGLGWNTCWAWTLDDYRERKVALDQACEAIGRDPATIWRSLGLYALCGEDEQDLQRRFDRLVQLTPPGVLNGMTLERWRQGRLVGTVQQIREQAEEWGSLGIETIIACIGSVPFQATTLDDLELLGHALTGA